MEDGPLIRPVDSGESQEPRVLVEPLKPSSLRLFPDCMGGDRKRVYTHTSRTGIDLYLSNQIIHFIGLILRIFSSGTIHRTLEIFQTNYFLLTRIRSSEIYYFCMCFKQWNNSSPADFRSMKIKNDKNLKALYLHRKKRLFASRIAVFFELFK